MEQRPHWSYTLYDLRRFRVLLLLPVTRVLVALLRGQPLLWYWYETVLLVFLSGYTFVKWFYCRYRLTASSEDRFHGIGVEQGVLWHRILRISAEDAASVEIERTPLLWLFGGRRVRVSTAGLRRRADVQLYLSAASTRELFLSSCGRVCYRASRFPVLVLALTGSNAAVGLLTAVPVLNRIGRALGEPVAGDMVGFFDRFLHLGLPFTLRLAADLLLVGWGIAAVRTFLRYAGFYARRETGYLHISSGLLTRREVLINDDKITGLELRQTVTMRLFSLYTAVITAAGYGRDIGTRPVLVPAARPRELACALSRLLPDYPACRNFVRPCEGAWRRYAAAPLATVAAGVRLYFFGSWWRFVAAVWLIAALWWLAVRLMGVQRAGFGCNREAISICYPRGLALYQVYLPAEVVDCISISQSCFQRRRGTCTVRLRCFGEKKRVHRVWELPYDIVRQFVK